MDAVRAVIHFTKATEKFEHDINERWQTTTQAGDDDRKT